MAGELSQPRRSRPVSGTPRDTAADQTLAGNDPSMAPITASTPLPPLTPLPLASQPGGGSAAPQPSPEDTTLPAGQVSPAPTPGAEVPQPPAKSEAGGVSSAWAAQTLFILFFTSLILIAAMAIAAAVISKSVGILIWIIVLTLIINFVYALVIFTLAQPTPGRARLPFQSPRRGA